MSKIEWQCECGETFETEPERHVMAYCPGCEDEWVDHEEAYTRRSMGIEPVE